MLERALLNGRAPGGRCLFMITLHVNGEPRSFESAPTVSKLLEQLDVRAPAVAVEINRTIVPRSSHAAHTLADGDRVEIVTFVGGG